VEAEASIDSRPLEGFTPRQGQGLPLFGKSFNTPPSREAARIDFQFDRAAFTFKFLPFTLPYPVPFRLLGDERKVGLPSWGPWGLVHLMNRMLCCDRMTGCCAVKLPCAQRCRRYGIATDGRPAAGAECHCSHGACMREVPTSSSPTDSQIMHLTHSCLLRARRAGSTSPT
jgi:hypothetical protein